ncbi:MAG: hypothetical protein WCC90_04065, partial [Methylocella sp.]
MPVKVEVGLKAEVKAEIPSDAVGRWSDALLDVIRPFTEGRGLRADQIRMQRVEIAYKIAQIAHQEAKLYGARIRPIPNKILVPFLEKASLEDSDNEMQKRWASLLLSASQGPKGHHLAFTDTLSRLTGAELKLLEDVCFAYPRFPETTYPDGHKKTNRQTLTT